jgi:hypothetical protein
MIPISFKPPSGPAHGLSMSAGSQPAVAAIKGYMEDRNQLVTELSQISCTYARETTRHARIVDEIKRIDGHIFSILDDNNETNHEMKGAKNERV